MQEIINKPKEADLEQIRSEALVLCDSLLQNRLPTQSDFKVHRLYTDDENDSEFEYADFSFNKDKNKYFAQFARNTDLNRKYKSLKLKTKMSTVLLDMFNIEAHKVADPRKLIEGFPISQIVKEEFICIVYPYIEGASFDDLDWEEISFPKLNYIARQAWVKRRGLLEIGVSHMDMGVFLDNTIIDSNFKLNIIDVFELELEATGSMGYYFKFSSDPNALIAQIFDELNDVFFLSLNEIDEAFFTIESNRTHSDIFNFQKDKILYYIGCYLAYILKDKSMQNLLSQEADLDFIYSISERKLSKENYAKALDLFNILKNAEPNPSLNDHSKVISWVKKLMAEAITQNYYEAFQTDKDSMLKYFEI